MGFGNLGVGQWGSGDSGLDFPFYEEGGYTAVSYTHLRAHET